MSSTSLMKKDDGWAIVLGLLLLAISLGAVLVTMPTVAPEVDVPPEIKSPLKSWIAKPGGWSESPQEALFPDGKPSPVPGILAVCGILLLAFSVAVRSIDGRVKAFAVAFPFIFLLGVAAIVMEGQTVVKHYGFSDALWALLLGGIIANTIGTPAFIRPAVRTELYIKTGLVLLGADILFHKLLAMGVPGIFVAWVVTPIVLTTTFWFGQKILKIESPSLNMVISADMSVCGVSAAIATAAACRAKKEELSVAVGLSMAFTAVMMVVMPLAIKAMGMNEVLGGAWIGGTIDSTGAVGAAGAILGQQAAEVAVTIKMIQNILIGVIAFFVALYWVKFQTPAEEGMNVGMGEIWRRFPKFVLGFLAASVAFTLVARFMPRGDEIVAASISGSAKTLRTWLFCLAFVSIGLETNFRDLASQFKGGKPLVLYVVGQSLNLALTLFMAWLMFEKVFPNAVSAVAP
ncbi:MAG: putative sulfate exporter family transporter [Planctomycetaceae bacterium]|nr:putative sulfate exporter family transporter [Planctomycetaceae bacterium]